MEFKLKDLPKQAQVAVELIVDITKGYQKTVGKGDLGVNAKFVHAYLSESGELFATDTRRMIVVKKEVLPDGFVAEAGYYKVTKKSITLVPKEEAENFGRVMDYSRVIPKNYFERDYQAPVVSGDAPMALIHVGDKAFWAEGFFAGIPSVNGKYLPGAEFTKYRVADTSPTDYPVTFLDGEGAIVYVVMSMSEEDRINLKTVFLQQGVATNEDLRRAV